MDDNRVSDPHWFNADPDTDPDPAFFLIADPDSGSGSRIRIQDFMTKNWKKITAEKKLNFFGSKTTIYLFLGLHKGRPWYRRSLQLSKENIQFLKTWKFWTFFLFLWVIFALLDQDPDPATQINADPCGSGYGSETLDDRKLQICYRRKVMARQNRSQESYNETQWYLYKKISTLASEKRTRYHT